MKDYELIRLSDGRPVYIPAEQLYDPPMRQRQGSLSHQYTRLPSRRGGGRRRRTRASHAIGMTLLLFVGGFVMMGTTTAPMLGFAAFCFAPVYLIWKFLQRCES